MKTLVKYIGSCKECPDYKDTTTQITPGNCYCTAVQDTYRYQTNAAPTQFHRVLSTIYGIPEWCPLPDKASIIREDIEMPTI